ncbi:MAG: hypothetical protein J0L56_16835 [Chitinophagales bacterium]|nr:hypothetical protein [Chitinophagales bacterium]
MSRKKREVAEEITPSLLKFREKRKWQIAFRRYVLERNISSTYAPYFGLDIENIRKWFESQFNEGIGWSDFGVFWQFDHIVPVTYFDFSNEEELKLCWNFTNIRVEHFQPNKDRGNRLDVLAARGYFKKLFETTGYPVCKKLLHKIDQIELSEIVSTAAQESFILANRDYLNMIETYSNFEFELLNTGRSVTEVEKEIGFIKNFKH